MSRFGKVLKDKGVSQVQLAEKAGVTKGTVCALVQKGIRNINTAKKYAVHLGVGWMEIVD